jgi:hypothetical protein
MFWLSVYGQLYGVRYDAFCCCVMDDDIHKLYLKNYWALFVTLKVINCQYVIITACTGYVWENTQETLDL